MKAFEIQKVLIPIDFSETSLLAIQHGVFMAKLFKADIILLHVIEKNWERFNIVDPEVKIETPLDLAERLETRLNDIAEEIRQEHGILSKVICSAGHICPEVVNIATEYKVDVIVMGTHGISGIEEFFIGSNTFKVVTTANCPVISVQANSKKIGFKDIVLPIDNSDHSRQKVNHVVKLAKHYASRIHILGLPNEIEDLNKFEIKLDQVQSYIETVGLPFVRKTVMGKNQAVLTLDYAKKVNADLIAIMTDQHDEHTGVFIGPYAQQIVNHSRIPVFSIRPEEHPENIPWVHPY